MEPITNFLNIFASEENSINYLVECGVFTLPQICLKCGFSNISLSSKSWRCTRKQCRFRHSISDSTFVKKWKLPYNDVLMLSYFWLSCANNKQIEMYTGHCKSTVTHYKKFLRQLVSDSLDFIDFQIGGENISVEIDETKMGKNKHHRGHSVNGAWILGGVERTEERRLFLVEVSDRTEATLLGIIRTHVLPGSIIMTDFFRSYHNLNQFYTHVTVNHSNTFKDPETGAHTNSIEGTLNAPKYQIPPRNRTNSLDDDGHVVQNVLNDHLGEFEWRRKHSSDL